MSEDLLPEALLDELRRFDTPTICNALEEVMPARRAIGFTTENMVCADPSLPPMVGYARTATMRAAEPSGQAPAEIRAGRAAYYTYIAEGPAPAVVVMQDLDAKPGIGAFWGEVNSNVHHALGALGVVTNGSIRDLDALAAGFQLVAGNVGPSHAWVHVVDFGGQVNVFGMTVRHGDLIHADRHGGVMIPREAAPQLPAVIDRISRREAVILAACKRPDFTIDVLKQAMADSAEIH